MEEDQTCLTSLLELKLGISLLAAPQARGSPHGLCLVPPGTEEPSQAAVGVHDTNGVGCSPAF